MSIKDISTPEQIKASERFMEKVMRGTEMSEKKLSKRWDKITLECKIQELEAEKAELICALKNIVGTCKNFASNVDIKLQKEILNKYEVK